MFRNTVRLSLDFRAGFETRLSKKILKYRPESPLEDETRRDETLASNIVVITTTSSRDYAIVINSTFRNITHRKWLVVKNFNNPSKLKNAVN